MIRKTLLFVAALLCLGTTLAFAEHEGKQETQPAQVDPKIFSNMFRLPSLIDCGSPTIVMEMLAEYEEVPVANGRTFVLRPDGMVQPGPFTLFINSRTQTFSFVVQFTPEGIDPIWCIIGAGTDFGPVAQKTML